jgi:hypothetical protein
MNQSFACSIEIKLVEKSAYPQRWFCREVVAGLVTLSRNVADATSDLCFLYDTRSI